MGHSWCLPLTEKVEIDIIRKVGFRLEHSRQNSSALDSKYHPTYRQFAEIRFVGFLVSYLFCIKVIISQTHKAFR